MIHTRQFSAVARLPNTPTTARHGDCCGFQNRGNRTWHRPVSQSGRRRLVRHRPRLLRRGWPFLCSLRMYRRHARSPLRGYHNRTGVHGLRRRVGWKFETRIVVDGEKIQGGLGDWSPLTMLTVRSLRRGRQGTEKISSWDHHLHNLNPRQNCLIRRPRPVEALWSRV